MKLRNVTVILTLLSTILLTGCVGALDDVSEGDSQPQTTSESNEENSNNSEYRINPSKDKKYGLNVYNFKQEVKDGNYVECLVYHENGAAGLSCNWERYNQMYPLEKSK